MVSLEQFHENIWKMFFKDKKTLDEALEVFESMSIESKALMSMMAFKKDSGKTKINEKGEEVFELAMDPEELEHFTLFCKQKEKEGFFDDDPDETTEFKFTIETPEK